VGLSKTRDAQHDGLVQWQQVRSRRIQPIKYVAEQVISSAQNLEDVLLFRVFGGKDKGFYVDVGAGDPNWDSVTRWFYMKGWSGLNIEANPRFITIYQHWRPRDVNLSVGISRADEQRMFHQVGDNGWGLSSFEQSVEKTATERGLSIHKIAVRTRSLASIVDEYLKDTVVDFLKIDVEGSELAVVESADWTKFRPIVLCIEAVVPCSAQCAFQAWEPIVLDAGYTFALFDGVNNFYVRDESGHLLPQFNAGVNCNDRYRRMELSDAVPAG
jgi:FkbM family methyltransferase